MPRLFLLDGTALAYRSHFALAKSTLATADGTPTGATYQFTVTLRRILAEEEPDLFAVAFDARGPTFRHARYKEYKATREKAPAEMLAQMDFIRDIVRAHGLPIFEIPGFEADDVIGTLALQGEKAGYEVFLVTGDKDFMQLVSERVKLYNVFRPGKPLAIQGLQATRDKFGTSPDRVCDVLAIMGDASDNIPGVKGIGEKGAIKLINEFGTVAGLLERLEEVKGKTKEKIEASRDLLVLSRELVTIDTEVPLNPGFDSITAPNPDTVKLIQLFRDLEFVSLVAQVASQTPSDSQLGERDYHTVTNASELAEMESELREARAYAVDTETTSLFPMQAEIVGISFCAAEGRAWYVPFNAEPAVIPASNDSGDSLSSKTALTRALEPLLTDPGLERYGQNTKYDWLVLEGLGLDMPPPSFDTMVASFCATGGERRNHGLDALALAYFGMKKIPTKELIGTGKKEITMDQVPIDKVSDYACEDADVTWRLRQRMDEELEQSGSTSLFHDLEMPLVPVLAAMERRGIRIDLQLLEGLGVTMEKEIDALVYAIQGHASENFNVNSTKALGEILFEKLRIQDQTGVKRPKKTRTGWATDADYLAEKYGEVEIVKDVLAYREVQKLKSTYVDALPRYVNPKTGRIHCSFSQVSAATGRLASSDPNLQNIPVRSERGRQLRKAFIPRAKDEHGEWVLLAADYSQIELRILAHLSGDEHLRRTFEEGHDVHAATASRIFGVMPEMITREMRSQAKVINFGLLYGMGPSRVARETGFSLAESRKFIEKYFASFPTVRAWMDGVLEGARKHGHVETLLGRRRRMGEVNSTNSRLRAFAENAAINTPVQGSAADVIKKAMIELEERLEASPLAGRMLLQVHDELVLEVPVAELEETREVVRSAMEEACVLNVPLKVDFGQGANWLEAH